MKTYTFTVTVETYRVLLEALLTQEMELKNELCPQFEGDRPGDYVLKDLLRQLTSGAINTLRQARANGCTQPIYEH